MFLLGMSYMLRTKMKPLSTGKNEYKESTRGIFDKS